MHGWMGEILHADLSNLRLNRIPTREYSETYLGGRGIASRIYWETVNPEIKAFDPENRLIFMTGPLVATGAQAASRMSVVGKSPMAFPEGYCYGNMGGYFGAELKKAGFDGIVIEGRASKPVYVWIHSNEAELLDASSLWGNGAYQTGEMLRHVHGEKAHFLTTGVAGERLVRTAVIVGSHDSTCSAGFGAVMGSKNFKAIVVSGNEKPSVSDPIRLKELNRYIGKISKRLRLWMPPAVEATHHGHLLEVIGKGGCYQCGVECIRGLYRYADRIEGYRKCQSMAFYLPWKYSREDEPVETFFDAPTMANDYAIETWELESMVDWLHACHEAGTLTEQETGLPLSEIGTREFLEKLLHAISFREDFGDTLAEGLARIHEKVSDRAQAMLSRTIAPIGKHDLFPPRLFVTNALLYSMEPRIHHLLLHEIGFVYVAWALNQLQPGLTPVTSKVFYQIAKTFWGSEEAGNLSSYDGKALAAKKIQNRCFLKDSLGLCDFAYPISYSFNTPDHVGDPGLEAEIFTAVTGIPGEDLDPIAERICNLQRAILVREGRNLPEMDFPLDYNFTEPLEYIPNFNLAMIPGLHEEAVDVTGIMLDRDRFKHMLKEYYNLRGWEGETGLPKGDTLVALGLEDLVPISS